MVVFSDLLITDLIGYFCSLISADSLFLATISENELSISSGDPIVWDTAPINLGGHYSTVLGTYEAPVTGYYQ